MCYSVTVHRSCLCTWGLSQVHADQRPADAILSFRDGLKIMLRKRKIIPQLLLFLIDLIHSYTGFFCWLCLWFFKWPQYFTPSLKWRQLTSHPCLPDITDSCQMQPLFSKGGSLCMKCEDSTFIGDPQAGEGQVAKYSCQPWVFLQCTCRSAWLCWHGNTPYSSERTDLVIYCTCLTLLPGICKIALSCPTASLSHHIADIPGFSDKGRSPKL